MTNDNFANLGGNAYISYATLAAWRGAVSETAAPHAGIMNGYEQSSYVSILFRQL
jgi:hypothetical protein